MKNLDEFIENYNADNHLNGDFSEYRFFTLIEETSTYKDSLFHKDNSINEEDIFRIAKYLDDFFSIYIDNFEGNEREPITGILKRILPENQHENLINKKHFPKVHEKLNVENKIEVDDSLLSEIQKEEENEKKQKEVVHTDDQTIIQLCLKGNVVVGGLILEYYSKRDNGIDKITAYKSVSYCILTYIFFEKTEKRKGLGSYLIKEKLPIIINNEIWVSNKSDKSEPPEYVFFEVDNPIYIDDKVSQINKNNFVQSKHEENCINRLNFFNKVGARWLDINYVQPKLSKKQSRVFNLFMMVLPHVSRGLQNPFIINKYRVLDFLISFYNTLEDDKKISFDDLNIAAPAIFSKDIDFSRIWLAIEIADAIDDFENKGKEVEVFKLKKLQKSIENQFDFIADEVKNLSLPEDINAVCEELNAIFRSHGSENLVESSKILNENLKNKLLKISVDESFLSLEAILKKLKDIIKPDSKEEVKDISKSDTIFDNDDFYLKEVPKFEIPKLLFDRASVAFHIALKPEISAGYMQLQTGGEYQYLDIETKEEIIDKLLLPKKKDNGIEKIIKFKDLVCPIFTSYGNDLLAYNYYGNKAPVKSKSLGSFIVEVTFPYKLEFLSEGRKESLFINVQPDQYAIKTDPDEEKYYQYTKTIKCFLNFMYFDPDEHKDILEKYEKNENPNKEIIQEYEVCIAKNIVWELVFTNDTELSNNTKKSLSEFEIIQLSKFFSGKQEKSNIGLCFKNIDQSNTLFNNIIELLNRNKNKEASLYDIHAGTIQIDTTKSKIIFKEEDDESIGEVMYNYNELFLKDSESKDKQEVNTSKYSGAYFSQDRRLKALMEEYLKDNVNNIALINEIYTETTSKEEQISKEEVYRNIRDFHYDDSFTGFEDRYKENSNLKYFFDALCGISLGIFDFGRMGYEEVTDTISPLEESCTDKDMIIMKRGSLFSCCHENSVYESSINTIGISPYLIIPNSVLVYNRIQADDNKKTIDDLYELSKEDTKDDDFLKIREKAKKSLKVKNNDLYQIFINLRKKTEVYIDQINIPNIFNYPTEREIYTTGMDDRGISENIGLIKETKKELDENIKDLLEVRQTIFSILITIFLGIISFVGFWEPIVNHIDIEWEGLYIANGFLKGEYTINLGAILFNFLFIAFIVYFGSRLGNILPRYVTIDWKPIFEHKIAPVAIILIILLIYFVQYSK